MKRYVVAALFLALMQGALPAYPETPPSSGGSSLHRLKVPLVLSKSRFPAGRELIGVTIKNVMPGERRLLTARLTAKSRSWRAELQQAGLGCHPAGAPVREGGTTRTSRNNRGIHHDNGAGPGILSIDVRHLFVASAPGSYRCSLWGRSTGERLAALPAKSYMTVSVADEPMAQQWSGQACEARGRRDSARTPVGSYCEYLAPPIHPGGTPNKAKALLSEAFIGDGAARAVEVYGDLQMTSCYRNTASCVPAISRYAKRWYDSKVLVGTRLVVSQLDRTGALCGKVTYDPPKGARRTFIPGHIHHRKVSHRLIHTFDDADGCTRRLRVFVSVQALAGDPLKITERTRLGTVPEETLGLTMSNAIARNLYR